MLFFVKDVKLTRRRARRGHDAGAVAAGHAARSWATASTRSRSSCPSSSSRSASRTRCRCRRPGSARSSSGADSLTAAKRAFARLFIPGTFALLTNVLGFAVIMLIPIDIVRELGITASLGVAWMIVTNKMLLPILLSQPAHVEDRRDEGRLPGEPASSASGRAASGCVEKGKATVIVGHLRGHPRGGHRRGAQPQGGRLRHRRAGAAPRVALQHGQREDHREVRHGHEHAGRGRADQGRAGRVHQLRGHERHREVRLVHAERARARSR